MADEATVTEPLMTSVAEIAALREMRQRAATLHALPENLGDYASTMRASAAYVLFGELPNSPQEVALFGAMIEERHAQRLRARTYIQRPEDCTLEGLIEWIDYFTEIPVHP